MGDTYAAIGLPAIGAPALRPRSRDRAPEQGDPSAHGTRRAQHERADLGFRPVPEHRAARGAGTRADDCIRSGSARERADHDARCESPRRSSAASSASRSSASSSSTTGGSSIPTPGSTTSSATRRRRSAISDPSTSRSRATEQLVAEQFRRRLSGEVDHVEYTFHGRRKDGSIIEIQAHGSAMDTGGRPVLISVLMDITERARTEREVLALQAQLREQSIHDALDRPLQPPAPGGNARV